MKIEINKILPVRRKREKGGLGKGGFLFNYSNSSTGTQLRKPL